MNEEENYETTDNSSNQDKDKDEEMTLDYEPSTPYPPNSGKVIDINDETDTTENFCKTNTKPILTTIISTST